MKVIGRIEPKLDEIGQVMEEREYLGGTIIMFTSYETHLLKLLQESSEGHSYNQAMLNEIRLPRDVEMSDMFRLIWKFIETRFAINEFKKMVKELEKLENLEDDEL